MAKDKYRAAGVIAAVIFMSAVTALCIMTLVLAIKGILWALTL